MFDQPSLLFTLFAFVAVLGPLVFFHELGHYWVGRWCGIRADVFSIGFGREVIGWTDRRGTRWKVGWLPLGGYVQFAGDGDAMSTPHELGKSEPEGSFAAAALWKRSLTVLAGPMANFILAIAILTVFIASYGRIGTPPVAQVVQPGSAAEAAGIEAGDRFVSIDGRAMDSFPDIPMAVAHRAGQPLTVVVSRNGVERTVTVTPRLTEQKDRFGNTVKLGIMGVGNRSIALMPVSIIEAPVIAVEESWAITRQIGEVMGQLLFGQRSIKDLGGPLAIAKASGEQASLGIAPFVLFVAMISLNLGFVNLLPLPMLDGGHLLFNAIEAVRRRPVSVATQQWAFRAGFFALASLMLIVTFNDLSGFGLWQKLAGLIG